MNQRTNSPKKINLLVYGDIGGSGGYVRYIQGIFGQSRLPDDFEITFICPPQFAKQLGPLLPQVRLITHPWMLGPTRLHRYAWHTWVYPRLAARLKPDLEFYPSGQVRLFMRRAVSVATCHNLLLFDPAAMARIGDPNQAAYFRGYRRRLRQSFRMASGVIFTSEYSRKLVLADTPAIRAHAVVPHGLDPVFLEGGPRSYELGPRPVILYVSSLHPYKNHVEVIQGVAAARQASGLDLQLRLVGGGPDADFRHLESEISSLDAGGFVHLDGPLAYADILQAYRSADLFVYASSVETFGITLLEAMAARLPVACSRETGLPEILKDGGVYFDPLEPDEICAALMDLLASPERRAALAEKGRRYAAAYTWQAATDQTFAFLRGFVSRRR